MQARKVLAANIRAIAKAKGVAVTHVADRAGVSRAMMFRVLAGTSAASTDWLEAVAKALDVDVPALFEARLTVTPVVRTLGTMNTTKTAKPVTGSKRDERLGLRLSAEEMAMAQALADADGLSVSDVFRLAVRRAYAQFFPGVIPTKRGKK